MNIDLNADVAEGCGQDDKLLTIVSSANVCCGLHAGSYAEMIATLKLAKKTTLELEHTQGLTIEKTLVAPISLWARRAIGH